MKRLQSHCPLFSNEFRRSQRRRLAQVACKIREMPESLEPRYLLSSVGLGTAANFAVLGVDHSTIAISGSTTTVNGNLGLGPNGTQNFSTGTINGNYDVDPTADNAQTNSVVVAGSTSVTDLSGAVANAAAASTALAGMTATQSFGAITGSSTITGNGGVNVIDVSSISLSGSSSLNLSGGPNDVFYINDPGDFEMTDSSTIGGIGVTPSQVIFNITGSGNAVSFSGSSVGGGTFLATQREIDVSGAIVNGAIIGGENAGISLTSGAMINFHEFVPPSPIPTITTSAGNSVVLGSGMNLSDTATLSGANSPTGTITFYLFAPGVTPNASDSNSVYSDAVTVNGNGNYGTSSGTNPGGYLPTTIGTYQWVAVYSGDTKNQSVSSNYGDEPQDVVSPAAISTFEGDTLKLGSGNKLYDSAELIGGINPTGTITFYLFAPGVTPNATDSNNIYSDTVTVNGDKTYDITMGTNPGGYLPITTGTYQWVALYSGDANNPPAASEFGDEPQKVVPPAPTITTNAGSAVVLGSGSVLSDSATLSGGVNPTGTVTFYLFAPGVTPNADDSNAIYSDAVTVTGNGTYSTSMGNHPGGSLMPAAIGTYEWFAVYSGDANNQPATSAFGLEAEVVASPPAISTFVGPSVVLGSGAKLTDSAILTAGLNPTGTVTLYLFAPGVTPDATNSNAVYSDTVTLSGSLSVDTSAGTNPGGYLPTVTGTYQWIAVYGGDMNNPPAASEFADEPETVTPSSPPNTQVVVFKVADRQQINAGDNAGFTVKIQNVGAATADGLTLSDSLPGGVGSDINWQIDTSGAGFGTGTEPADFIISGAVGHQTLTLAPSVSTLPAGASLSVHITGGTSLNDVDPTVPACHTTLANTATVDAENEPANEQNAQATASITLHNVDVDVAKEFDNQQQGVVAGQQVGFTIQIYNQGCVTATGFTLNDPLSAGNGNDIFWQIDPTQDSPSWFQIVGQIGHQELELAPGIDTFPADGYIVAHVIGQTTIHDVGNLNNLATVYASNEPAFEQQKELENAGNNSNGPRSDSGIEISLAPQTYPLALYIQAAFQQILGRAPSSSDLASALAALSSGLLSRQAFAEALTHSAEYDDRLVERDYAHYLGRNADSAGLLFWQQALENGMSDEQLEADFIASPEYYFHAGGTDKAWVDHMYFDLLGRAPDAAGESFWVAALAAGQSRSSVALGFAASPEREGITVQNDYQAYLGRLAGSGEVAGWVQAFVNGEHNENVIAGFVASDEYFALHT